VLLAYIDESGNTGSPKRGGSLTYALGCVLVDAANWATAFDEVLALRRRLRASFELPMRAEVKAKYLIRNTGPIQPLNLSPAERYLIYRAHLSVLAQLPSRAFAIVVDKRDRDDPAPSTCFDLAWEGLLQRLERTSSKEATPFLIFHDEGENMAIRGWVRRARRNLTAGSAFAGSGPMRNPARLLVDDPVARKSHQSYFVQMADLAAYAAFRAVIPPGPKIAPICPESMWMELRDATHRDVNKERPRGPAGIVLR